MQRRVLLVVCLLTIAVSGCKHFSFQSSEQLSITQHEKEFAESLAHFSQGLIYTQENGPYSLEALQSYETALNLAPDESVEDILIPHLLRYSIVMQTNNAAMARIDKYCTDYYTEIIKSDRKSPLAYVTLARMHFKNGRDKKALALLKEGINKLENNDPLRLFCRLQGQDFFLNKEFRRALSCFELLPDQEADNYERFHITLGELHTMLDQPEKAVKNYRIAAEGDNPIPEAYILIAGVYSDSDQQKSIEILKEACLKFPDNPKLLFYLAFYYTQNDNYPEAIKVYQKIKKNVEDDPGKVPTADFYLAYGAAYEEIGEIDKAADVFQEGITHYPQSAIMLNYLAYMWADSDQKLDKALELVNRALAIDKENGAYIDTLGWIYFRQKHFNKASKQLLKANELMPGDPTIMEHIGDVYKAMKQNDEALRWWKSSYSADPKNTSVTDKLKNEGIDILKLTVDSAKDTLESESEKTIKRN